MGEWIKWDGGPCQIKDGMTVDVKLRSGEMFFDVSDTDDFPWKHIWGEADIVAYRIVKDSK